MINNKFLIVGGLGLLLIGCVGIICYDNFEEVEKDMEEVYSGPVPQGYDLEHFRKTGITREIIDG